MNQDLKLKVYRIIKTVPAGKVVSYGQLAILCDMPNSARIMGKIAHYGPINLPWHRLVKSDGSMASGFVPGGPTNQLKLLQTEGIELVNKKVNMVNHRI